MSRIHKILEAALVDRPRRRSRRSTTLTLTTLESRRLMTSGVATAIAPAAVQPVPTAAMKVMASEPASLAIAGDSEPTDAWIYTGSEAQFGPTGPYVLYGGGNAWPTTPAGSSPDASPDQAKLDAAFAKQSTDLQAIQDKSEITPKLLASLRTARAMVAAQAGRPDATLLKTFQDDAQKVQESGAFTDAKQKQLKDEYTAVLKSAGVSDDAVAALFAAQDAVKAASHVTMDDVALLAADQHAVQTLVDAMPHDAVAFAEADAFRGNAAGAPRMLHDGAAMNSSGATTTAVPISGAMLAGAAVDPNTAPATLAATSTPVTPRASAPGATNAPPTPSQALYARALAMARGTTIEGGLLPRSPGIPSAQRNTVSVPVIRTDTSNVPLLNAAMKRSSHRSVNTVRNGAVVRGITPGTTTTFPAIRQRVVFTGSMRKPTTS